MVPEASTERNKIPNVWFHGSPEKYVDLIREHGLIGTGDNPTLTSDINYPYNYQGKYITVWYPHPKDFARRLHLADIDRSISSEERERLRSAIASSSLKEWEKKLFMDRLSKGYTRLIPYDRLGAIIVVPNAQIMREHGNFRDIFSSPECLDQYLNDKQGLIKYTREFLDSCTIVYLHKDKTQKQLTEDIVVSAIRNQLLQLGEELKDPDLKWRKLEPSSSISEWMEVLENVHFQEPAFERYRLHLLSRYKKR